MGKFRLKVTKIAQKDIDKHIKSGNKNSIKAIEKIMVELTETPIEGYGNPEALKHEFSGYWSRRINAKDRMIYKVEENIVTVTIVSAMGHYSDK